MRTPQQPRAIKTRNRVLRDAAQLFALKGLHDTKLDEIIKAAEVTSGAFFHHFKGKEELGFAVIDHHMEFRVHLDEAVANCGLSGDQDTREMARYIVSVIEGTIMLSRTHRDVNVIERQVHHLKQDLKRSFQTTDAMSR
ncbi:MAG TPA: TetR/AcrR family transcriptional regulator [Pirellulaceae bacterium]|nr:TetR/AcrR family transcriptional regulator [Pirellulaceae bacterium]